MVRGMVGGGCCKRQLYCRRQQDRASRLEVPKSDSFSCIARGNKIDFGTGSPEERPGSPEERPEEGWKRWKEQKNKYIKKAGKITGLLTNPKKDHTIQFHPYTSSSMPVRTRLNLAFILL